jgi:hypothetical protein
MASKTIDVTVRVPTSYLSGLIKDAELKIVDREAFKAYINSTEFKKILAADLLTVWMDVGVDSDPVDVAEGLFGDHLAPKWDDE